MHRGTPTPAPQQPQGTGEDQPPAAADALPDHGVFPPADNGPHEEIVPEPHIILGEN